MSSAQGQAILLVNARLLDPASGLDAPGRLAIADGVIAAVEAGLPATPAETDARVIDCGGACVAPGLVDLRVHTGEPGEEHKETIASAARAAAAGGVTAFLSRPDTLDTTDTVAAVEFIARRARDAKASKVFAQACLTRGANGTDLAELGLLAEAGAVAFTDGNHVIRDSAVMLRALQYARTFDLLVMQHPEEPTLARGGDMNAGETATRLGLVGIPAQAEVIAIERDLRLVEMTGTRYHIHHVSTAAAVDVIRAAKHRGLAVTCDTAPPYFLLSEIDVAAYRTFAKLSPPLRSDTDRKAVVEGVRDGTIDAIASDHTPHDQESKRLPFSEAAAGVLGLETLLATSLSLVHGGKLSLLDLIARLSTSPARLARLPFGELAVGRAADLVVFDPQRAGKVEPDRFASLSRNCAFDGMPVEGRVLSTYVDGRCIYAGPDAATA